MAEQRLDVNLDELGALLEADARLQRLRLDLAAPGEACRIGRVLSEERYRLLLDWLLAGEPGGLIPLDSHTSETGTTGRSPIEHP